MHAHPLDARIAHVEGAFDQVNERLNSIDQELDGFDRRFEGIDRRFGKCRPSVQVAHRNSRRHVGDD